MAEESFIHSFVLYSAVQPRIKPLFFVFFPWFGQDG